MQHQRGSVIELRGAGYRLPEGRAILSQIDLTVARGETLVLLGRSGSGKTTVLKLINCLLEPSEGEVLVEGQATTVWDRIRLRRRIGYVIQETGLFPALCPLYTIVDFEQVNSSLRQKGAWERVRKGQVEGLHLIASIDRPEDNRACFVVDFRQIYSLPADYLKVHAASLGSRWRLQSPYLEHFSQAFARFFMRVGLPSSIPPYK